MSKFKLQEHFLNVSDSLKKKKKIKVKYSQIGRVNLVAAYFYYRFL